MIRRLRRWLLRRRVDRELAETLALRRRVLDATPLDEAICFEWPGWEECEKREAYGK